jgi:hypothetical protein
MSRQTLRSLQYFLVVLIAVLSYQVRAQDQPLIDRDTVIIESEDTVAMKSYAARYDPNKALLFAAAIPGLGQIYNKKYWKLPLVYGGAYVVGWQISKNSKLYRDYRRQIFENIEAGKTDPADKTSSGYQLRTIRNAANRARRERDFYVIIMGLVYVLQIVDAHVDAHLKEFDLNPNLKVAFRPTVESDPVLGKQTGLSLTMKF